MAKFLLIGRKCINLENVDYVDLGKEGDSMVTIYFGGQGDVQRAMQFSGDDALRLWELLEEEKFFGTSSPRP